jgi:DNA-binding NtrC family response regulator
VPSGVEAGARCVSFALVRKITDKRHFAHYYSRASLQLAAATLHKLIDYPWPGNVRELDNMATAPSRMASSS